MKRTRVYMRALGSRGGHARARKLSAEELSAIGRLGGIAHRGATHRKKDAPPPQPAPKPIQSIAEIAAEINL